MPLGYILLVKETGLANGLDVGNDRKKKKINDDSWGFSLRNWVTVEPCMVIGKSG